MKIKQKWNIILLLSLFIAVIFVSGFYYISSVHSALWDKSVTDISEVTAQGSHALDTYIEKETEMLDWLAAELSAESSHDADTLISRMNLASSPKSSYICINLDTGIVYTDQTNYGIELKTEQLENYRLFSEQGIREPYLDDYTGVWTIGYYKRFIWSDGAEGIVQKTQKLSDISERFSLSFYNDTGFSYVVNQNGDILIRSQHRNSNRTFQNLFDIIDLQGNDINEIASFKEAFKSGKSGAARFNYQKEDYVFCYVPIENTDGWYVVSIIPNSVIMEQSNNIIKNSQIFLFLILASALIMAAFIILYRKATRQILLAEEKARKSAESANIAKSQFLSNMSHDIRTPMNAVTGMTKLALDHVDEPEKVKEYLKNIDLSGQLLVGLINDILDMSKIESGKMALNNDTASLENLLINLVKIIQPTAEKKKQNFSIHLHNIVNETLCFDALRLNQILLNLLSNALKFTPDGGSISVDVTETQSVLKNHAHFTFRVSDTGIGMKPEFIEHIFDSFTREKNDFINQIEGTGLGMAITKMIVDMMNGSISVQSIPEKGSVFIVDLDLLLPEDNSQETLNLPSLRILVADDDFDTCRSADDFLHDLGMDADVTDSGKAAVEKAVNAHENDEDYSLVLLDWKMPDLNGLDAAQAIRSLIGNDVPIIIISAYDWTSIEKQAIEAGVNGFIQKPFFRSTLYHCIKQYVLNEKASSEETGDEINLSGRRILLAEDNEINRLIACELLSGCGAQVDVAENGLICTELFEQSPAGYYDLILMDIQMPVMNGYEATRCIRDSRHPDADSIPIFAMTADAFAEDIELTKKVGMNSHLAKPLDIPAMMREIKKYLRL